MFEVKCSVKSLFKSVTCSKGMTYKRLYCISMTFCLTSFSNSRWTGRKQLWTTSTQPSPRSSLLSTTLKKFRSWSLPYLIKTNPVCSCMNMTFWENFPAPWGRWVGVVEWALLLSRMLRVVHLLSGYCSSNSKLNTQILIVEGRAVHFTIQSQDYLIQNSNSCLVLVPNFQGYTSSNHGVSSNFTDNKLHLLKVSHLHSY